MLCHFKELADHTKTHKVTYIEAGTLPNKNFNCVKTLSIVFFYCYIYFEIQKNVVSKTILRGTIFWVKEYLWSNKFLHPKISGSKIFKVQKHYGIKKFWAKNMLGPKKCSVQKVLGPKVLETKKCWV